MPKADRPCFATYKALAEWLSRPTAQDEIRTMSPQKIQKAVKADTGYLLTTHVILKAVKELNMVYGERGHSSCTRNMSDNYSAFAVLARHVRGMADSLGYDLGLDRHDLDKLVARKKVE